ncbi:MAG: hypothetical protein DRJ05_05955, partial [Bacteroidetes bacterium]
SYNGYGNNLFIDNVKVRSTEAVGETFDRDDKLRIFPNPNTGTFSIMLIGISGNASYEIFNLTGQVISNGYLENNSGTGNATISISDEHKGVYFVKVSYNGIIESRKLIVQ